jgi:hypothetical protein
MYKARRIQVRAPDALLFTPGVLSDRITDYMRNQRKPRVVEG